MVSFPYYSHSTPIRIPKDIGIVWEAYQKGGPTIGSPWNHPWVEVGYLWGEAIILTRMNGLYQVLPSNQSSEFLQEPFFTIGLRFGPIRSSWGDQSPKLSSISDSILEYPLHRIEGKRYPEIESFILFQTCCYITILDMDPLFFHPPKIHPRNLFNWTNAQKRDGLENEHVSLFRHFGYLYHEPPKPWRFFWRPTNQITDPKNLQKRRFWGPMVHPRSLTARLWKMLIGRLLSYWVSVTFEGLR